MSSELIAEKPRSPAGRGQPTPDKYYSYAQALSILERRWKAIDREIAAWIYFEALVAYRHVYEFAEPPKTIVNMPLGISTREKIPNEPEYLDCLEGMFFLKCDVDSFVPEKRYISFDSLKKRWAGEQFCKSEKRAINAMWERVRQSRLMDFAPGYGLTRLTEPEWSSAPPVEWGMFDCSYVEDIEKQDFSGIGEYSLEQPIDQNPSVVPEQSQSNDWRVSARAIAEECFKNDTDNNCRDSLVGYSCRVMEEMQKRKIHGPRGLIDNKYTIQREALQGKKWWANKTK